MRVDDDAGGDAVPRAQDDVGGFARDAGELEHLVHGLGDLAVEFFDEHACGADDVLRLGAVEACGFDELLDRGGGGFGEGFGSGEEAEELRGGFVDADVGGLGGEDGRDGQLKSIAVIQGADDVGVGLAERVEDGGDAFGGERVLRLAGLGFG